MFVPLRIASNLARIFSLFLTLALLLSACKKEKSTPGDVDTPTDPTLPECKLIKMTSIKYSFPDTVDYYYDGDRIVKVEQVISYDRRHSVLEIFYPSNDEIAYKAYMAGNLVIDGRATLKDGKIEKLVEQVPRNNTSTTFNCVYTNDGYLLRIREGSNDYQDYEYKEGNLVAIYDTGTPWKYTRRVEYSDIKAQPELSATWIPFYHNERDMELIWATFYKMGYFGKKSKLMPKVVKYYHGETEEDTYNYSYETNDLGQILKMSMQPRSREGRNDLDPVALIDVMTFKYLCK